LSFFLLGKLKVYEVFKYSLMETELVLIMFVTYAGHECSFPCLIVRFVGLDNELSTSETAENTLTGDRTPK
jgi:hypothetical protein